MRAAEVGEQAWFVLEEALLWGREAKMCHTASYPDLCPFLFSCWNLKRCQSQRLRAPRLMSSHKPPTSFQSRDLRLNTSITFSETASLPRAEGGSDAMRSAASLGRRAALPRGCVPHCHLVTGPESREPAARGQ